MLSVPRWVGCFQDKLTAIKDIVKTAELFVSEAVNPVPTPIVSAFSSLVFEIEANLTRGG
jgi:hypothetical protein